MKKYMVKATRVMTSNHKVLETRLINLHNATDQDWIGGTLRYPSQSIMLEAA